MGIVHRDLKPANIMLSRHGLVKVMDFGIAKARIASANITTAGQVRGTPIYMAPEQVTGKELDGRADQFAAATVLYELLTGKQLFIAKNLVRIMQQVARAEVEEQVNELENLHPGVGRIAARMWSQDVEARYETCDEPAQLLEDIVFDLKAHQRSAQMTDSNPGPRLQSKADALPSSSEPTFLSALGLAVRNLLSTEKTPVTPTPKKRRRRKRKKKSSERETLARPVTATANPDPTASDSVEMLFDDQVSDFDLPVVSESQATPNIARPSTAPPPAAPNASPPTAVKEDAPSQGMQSSPTQKTYDKSDGALDPFFYEDYD
jgi:serine/threonine protein kinase